METLKQFLEAKLAKVGCLAVQWYRKEGVTYVSYIGGDHGFRVVQPVSELVDELLWQEDGI